MPELQTLMTGLAFGESPRWHDDRLWFADWGAQEIVAVDLEGESEIIARVPSFPFCIDWLPDGRLLIVSASDGLLLRREPDGSLVTHADLTSLSDHPWNEIVVDGRGNAYVNNIGFDFSRRRVRSRDPRSGHPRWLGPAGGGWRRLPQWHGRDARQRDADPRRVLRPAAHGVRYRADGGLSNRRVWADLDGGAPDGICLDAEGAVWYGDVPNQRCVRVREGGEVLQTIELDRGCFACMLGGADRQTLFMMAAEWRGPQSMADGGSKGQVLTARRPHQASAGHSDFSSTQRLIPTSRPVRSISSAASGSGSGARRKRAVLRPSLSANPADR